MRPRVLVVQNAPWEGPGLIASYARAAGIDLCVSQLFRRSGNASELPFAELEAGSFVAVVALGSPSTAYLPKTNPRHAELVRLFVLLRELRIPSFDVCYSMQLFCIAHGGKVIRNRAGKEVGFFEVSLTPEGDSDSVVGPVGAFSTLQWHGDIVEELPRGAVLLASSAKTKNQVAVVDGVHYLVQSDGQAVEPRMVRSWLKHDGKWALEGTGVKTGSLVRQAIDGQAYFRNTFLRIFGNFLGLAIRHD